MSRGRLIPGSAWFQVIEEPAYTASGAGEHLYVEIEKEGLTTDAVAEALAKACGKRSRDVGFAGRKDRHAITRQWFSVHFGEEARLAALPELVGGRGRVAVLSVSRHANKLRLGHLAGNRFHLGLADVADDAELAARLADMAREGVRNRFGTQRFGVASATLGIARAWGRGDLQGAVELIVDPEGSWRWGAELPSGYRAGPEGRALGALRQGAAAKGALAAAGDQLRKLVASAAQSAVFNAILDARVAAGLLHRFRVGDLGITTRGAPFRVAEGELDATNARAAPGVLDAFTSGPLPGSSRLRPDDAIDAEERSWAAPTGVDWAWLAGDSPLASPGERRPLVVPFRSTPILAREASDAGTLWLDLALPPGTYATEVLAQLDIDVPADRRAAPSAATD